MRIAIDASAVAERRRTGVANHVSFLLHSLSELDDENEYFVCHRLSRLRNWRSLLHISGRNFRGKVIQEPFNFRFMRTLDLFHGPDTRLPRSRATKTVATVHDVFSLISDLYASEKFRRKKTQRYQEAVDRAARIIAVSDNTRRDLCQLLGADPSRITVIPNGVSDWFAPRSPDEAAPVLRRLGIDRPFLLSVGALRARKNCRRMIEAFRTVAQGRDLLLVLTGGRAYGWERAVQRIEELGLEDRVRLPGYVAEEDLPALYSAARAFLFPSLYEGFGIPVLEAMACGAPVVTSNVSSLPEVAGDAALLVDPHDVEAIADATRRLLDDEPLRAGLRAKGLERAKLFPWSRTARETLRLYREVAETGHGPAEKQHG